MTNTETSLEGAICLLPEADRGDEIPDGVSRRSAIKIGVGALASLALIELGGAGFLFLRARSMEGEFGGLITAGLVDSFPNGSVTEFADGHFFLIRSPDGGFLAVHNRCTHLGCTVNWVESDNVFICPCHAASFDFFGNFDGPPVPRPLDTFEIEFEEKVVLVDTAIPNRREKFEPEQLAFCPVESRTASSQ
jgi:cytochrome b6-f complex iron-sulfur subunit